MEVKIDVKEIIREILVKNKDKEMTMPQIQRAAKSIVAKKCYIVGKDEVLKQLIHELELDGVIGRDKKTETFQVFHLKQRGVPTT